MTNCELRIANIQNLREALFLIKASDTDNRMDKMREALNQLNG